MEDYRHFLLLCFEMKASMQSALSSSSLSERLRFPPVFKDYVWSECPSRLTVLRQAVKEAAQVQGLRTFCLSR